MASHPTASHRPARAQRVLILSTLTAAIALAGCASKPVPPAPVVPPVVLPPVDPGPAPTPPDGAAANLVTPTRLADGKYATVNQGLSPEMAAWHLRAAFNVAALNCPDASLQTTYNTILNQHRAELARVHKSAAAQSGKQFDSAMTRVYNYFAQPPVLDAFCATAVTLAPQAAIWPKGSFATGAGPALEQLDYPFHQFYARYDAYRIALQNWQNSVATQAVSLPATAPSAPIVNPM